MFRMQRLSVPVGSPCQNYLLESVISAIKTDWLTQRRRAAKVRSSLPEFPISGFFAAFRMATASAIATLTSWPRRPGTLLAPRTHPPIRIGA